MALSFVTVMHQCNNTLLIRCAQKLSLPLTDTVASPARCSINNDVYGDHRYHIKSYYEGLHLEGEAMPLVCTVFVVS